MDNDKLLDMLQEIRETVVQMNTKMQYAQQNQEELKKTIEDIQKKLEEQNSKISSNTNNINNLGEKYGRWDKWGNVITSTIVVSLITAVLTLIIKTH